MTEKTFTLAPVPPSPSRSCTGEEFVLSNKPCKSPAEILLDNRPYCRRCAIWQGAPLLVIRALDEYADEVRRAVGRIEAVLTEEAG